MMGSKKRSRSEGSSIRPYESRESDVDAGNDPTTSSRTAESRGREYLSASLVLSWTFAYESVLSSGGRLANISSAKY